MIYTLRAGVDQQLKERIARGLLYGTGALVALVLAVAPFTGNHTFWQGGGSSGGSGSGAPNSTSHSTTAKTGATSSKKAAGSASTPSSSAATTTGTTASPTTIQSAGSLPIATGSTSIGSSPTVGRGGGDSTTTSPTPTTENPQPVVSEPAPTTLPLTICTPTASLDPLLTANPVCVN